MKRLLLKGRLALGVFMASSLAVSAQDISDYEHILSTSTYISLPGVADVLATGDEILYLEDETYTVALPFDFSYNGTLYTTIYVNTNGYIAFGGDCTIAIPVFDGNTEAEDGIIAACNADLLGASTEAAIRTAVIGTAPFRTFVIEWNNMDEWNNYVAAFLDPEATSLNFQIALHEGDGVPEAQNIDINYGAMTVTEDINVTVGLRYGGDVNLLTSATGWTTLTTSANNEDQVPLTAAIAPAAGTTITFTTDVALPVVLQHIAAVNEGQQNTVSWASASEAEGDLYILERSNDGKSFQQIGQLSAEGTPSQYRYTDQSPFTGKNYYRIKVLNNNQTSFFSKVVTATVATAGAIILAPNPAQDYIYISGLKAYSGGSISVINASGQQVYSAAIDKDNSNLDISGFAAGLYHVRIVSGTLTKTIKFIRQ